jgi:hypothetical protein
MQYARQKKKKKKSSAMSSMVFAPVPVEKYLLVKPQTKTFYI